MIAFALDDQLNGLVEELRAAVERRELSPKKRLALYRAGGHGDIVPVYLVTHSWACRQLGVDTEKFLSDFGLHAKGQIQTTLTLGHDYVYSAADIFDFEAEALGARLVFPNQQSMPTFTEPPLAGDKDFSRLPVPDPWRDGRMPGLLAMKQFLHRFLGDLFEFEATGSSPFSLACHLRGFENMIMDLFSDADYAEDLLEFCVQVCSRYLSAQLELGLSAVRIADAWAAFPMVNSDIFDRFITPAVKRLFHRLSAEHRTWTGLYGLSHATDWQRHLEGIISCGVTELCVYQEDLQAIDLKALEKLAHAHDVQIKAGLYGTTLAPYDSVRVGEMLKSWIAALGRNGGVGVHVSNTPWLAKVEDVASMIGQVRQLTADLWGKNQKGELS